MDALCSLQNRIGVMRGYTGMSRRHPRSDGSALKAVISFDGKAAAGLRTSATASPRA
jgi:hypothetical protein